jgi:ribosomal protein L39E
VRARYPLVGAVGKPLFANVVVAEIVPELGLRSVDAKYPYAVLLLLKFKSNRVVVAASTLIKESESVAVATHRRCWRRGNNTVVSYTTRA